jgi:hypothetical protein
MKSWLRDDRVYQAIMNGALWIVVIAALSTTKWPQLSWLAGSITAVLVVIVATVYWVAVVTNDNDNLNSTAQRQSTQLATGEEAQGRRNVAQERPSPEQRREEITEAYWNALSKNLEAVRNKNVEVLRSKTYEVLRRRLALINEDEASRIWTSNFDELMLRNWLVHTPHHGAELRALKSHRRAFTTRTLARIAAGEEETSGKVVVMVGSVRIEIQEDDPNKTTNVHITSPKTVVTNVTDIAERSQQKPQEYGPQRPTTTIH